MSLFKIDFEAMPWEEGRPGMRYKVYCEGSRQLRLVEFLTADGFHEWCEQGHIGYVLAGSLEIDIKGSVQTFNAGDGLFLPAGFACAHRSPSITPGTRLIMVEDL